MKPNGLIPLLAVFAMAAMTALTVALPAMVAADEQAGEAFLQEPKDRPVLETVQQVWEAETTGTASFYFGGEHYVIENLPKEYVKYSAWYCRMP